MRLDQHTVVFLTLDPDAPTMTDKVTAALQDAHVSYTADFGGVRAPRTTAEATGA